MINQVNYINYNHKQAEMRFSTSYYLKTKYKHSENLLMTWLKNNESSFLAEKKEIPKNFIEVVGKLNIAEMFALKIVDSADTFLKGKRILKRHTKTFKKTQTNHLIKQRPFKEANITTVSVFLMKKSFIRIIKLWIYFCIDPHS